MDKKRMINEIFALRSIACLCIVFLHAIEIALRSSYLHGMGPFIVTLFDSIQVFLYFGTPVFIFISELIIAYSYRNRDIPDHFLSRRFKFIFIPFIVMAFFYSIPYAVSLTDWGTKFFLNVVIGDFHGYFVLIIFQFYLLHLLLHNYLRQADPKTMILLSLGINIAYLALFNLTAAPFSNTFMIYLWERFYWIPFFGWIFYFTLGYYCGYYYEEFKAWVTRHRVPILIAPVVSTVLLLYFYHNNMLLVHSSKRVDILLHTTAIILVIMYAGRKMKHVPPFLVSISKYSFGIYLIHVFYLHAIDTLVRLTGLSLGAGYIFALFIASVYASIYTIKLANKWKYGVYILGKLGADAKGKSSEGVSGYSSENRLKPKT
ncbi:acyltransferase family protein [Alteribacter natronophilus]|uniref:acyltransferase family protein n=1 Tax=Alteribacter natronophilus TaxID=2583810 RepID=UPI0014874FB3|nr:acyltransferase family protein [Alteribacter natronophilus]